MSTIEIELLNNNKMCKNAWKSEEDAKLLELVVEYGVEGKWYCFQSLIFLLKSKVTNTFC
jgi:hypothetical protein